MSIRKSSNQFDSDIRSTLRGAASLLRTARRRRGRPRSDRRSKKRRGILEALEQRQLLAGPSLVGIQPNMESLLFDGTTLNQSPRQLTFRFDDSSPIDPETLGGIRITRAGADEVFDAAIASSDLGTNSQVLLEFRAVQAGVAGEGLEVHFSSSSRPGTGLPLIEVDGNQIQIDLNSNPARPTQVRDLISAVDNHPDASELLKVFSVSGATLFPLGTNLPEDISLTLRGANAADASSDLGTGGESRVRFLSMLPGPQGQATEVVLQRADAGGAANPLVLVDGKRITVRVNSNPGHETTVDELIEAINSNEEASPLLMAIREAGPGNTLVGNRANFAQTILLTGAEDIVVEPGFVGLGDTPHEVVFRFAETLPDDRYQIDIFGSGPNALLNADGDPFNDGVNLGKQFRIDLGPQVAAVVPEPIRRTGNGPLNPEVGVIDVHFNQRMDPATVTNREFYQLIFTRDTASPLDDVIFNPTSVSYDAASNIAKLTFPGPLARLSDPAGGGFLPGAARLRIGNDLAVGSQLCQQATAGSSVQCQALPSTAPTTINVTSEPGDNVEQAKNLGNLSATSSAGIRSIRLESEIRNTVEFGMQFPGGPGAEGVRQIRPEDPSRLDRPVPLDIFRREGDDTNGITVIQYEFPATWRGNDPSVSGVDNLKTYFNLITEQQKRRVREALSLYSEYLGVQFVEVTNGPTQELFFSFAVGDLHGGDHRTTSGPGGLTSVTRDRTGNGFDDLVVMDFQDFDASTDDLFGGSFFRGAMLAIGQVIGFGFADHLPETTQSRDFVVDELTSEPTFPTVTDVINGQFLYRPDSVDIDLYRFELRDVLGNQPQIVSIQTFSERLGNASLLDTQLRLFREDPQTKELVEIAQNDDYFGNDSLIEKELGPGTYFVGVSAAGNNRYNPEVPASGIGGRSEGDYELRITTQRQVSSGIRDASGVLLDGDGNGVPGGVYDFWFVPADQSNTLYVDKAASAGGSGSLSQPYRNLSQAVERAEQNPQFTTIRMVANGGTDGRIETAENNFSYQIGFSPTGVPLPDGTSLDVPQGVRLVIDAGVVIKMRQARIGVGSTSPSVDRSDAAIQLLGTPVLIGGDGFVARDALGEPIPGNVIITSINDRTVGNGNVSGVVPAPRPGDWGGIDLRGDIDLADANRRNREDEGVFLNHIQHADIRFGGGQVNIDGRNVAVAPIDMALTRATVTGSRITHSADAAIAATPDSFRETRFDEASFQQEQRFTPVVARIGPNIYGNTVVENSINGLFVRVVTRAGDELQPLTTAARFDDTDIVHVLAENLVVQGNPGGLVAPAAAPAAVGIQGIGLGGGGEVLPGSYVYRISFFSPGSESLASVATAAFTLDQTGLIRLSQLPTVPAGSGFTGRRLYRAEVAEDGTVGEFRRVATLNASDVTFNDRATAGTEPLPAQDLRLNARPNARLAIDPGTLVKLAGARIDVTFGADLIAEGTPNNPVVFTSLNDDRFGIGGTFDTSSASGTQGIERGDWGGIYVGHTSSAWLDNVVVAGAGGTTRVPGGFASFNPIEVHQGQLRLANSRLETNADGRGFVDVNQLDRAGRAGNASGTVFVRGAQPMVINNDFVGGEGPVLSFDVNSMVWNEVADPGRATGPIDAMPHNGNSGPLVAGNRLDRNALNGMEIRGGRVATETVWDDVDMVHIVRDTIEVPNQHVFGGLRLASDARGSLVVKAANMPEVPATETTPAIPATVAGIVVGGNLDSAADQFVDIADRIGGSLQVVGHPDFPVVMTSLDDDSIGAGFTPTGRPQLRTVETLPDMEPEPDTGLPTVPSVDRGNLIDNNVVQDVPGYFEALIGDGNEILTSGVTVESLDEVLVAQDFVFQYSTFVSFGDTVERLADTTITQPATLIAPDTVESRGTFEGPNGVVEWVATSFFESGVPTLFSNLVLNSTAGQPLGDILVISYLDEDIPPLDDDILYTVGTPGQPDFRAFTVDNQTRAGFSQGGFYIEDGVNLAGANYVGWASDLFPLLLGNIEDGNQQFSIPGVINQVNLPARQDVALGTVYGPGDVTTAFAWRTDEGATQSRITSFLELIPREEAIDTAIPGAWNGITIREAAGDRNVLVTTENESRTASRGDVNNVPSQAQFLGELAPDERSGDENRRLGFIVDGTVLTNDDVDVYSFVAEAGTQVWLDIDRTDLSLNAVLELVDANGRTLVLSDSSLRESRGDIDRLVPDEARFDPDNARSMNVLPIPDGAPDSAYQDDFSINPNDPGMRVILPGNPGQRNLYHVRIRSSNVPPPRPNMTATQIEQERIDRLTNAGLLRHGLSNGKYQLQIRLREADEVPGTQVRFADVRFATNGVQVIGGPINGPLVGDIAETAGDNNTFDSAQPLGLFEVGLNDDSGVQAGPLRSNRLALSVAGLIDDETDIDWYRFEVNFENLTRDAADLFLATIFDIDYADGFARADLGLYVFDEAGQLILIGGDSNIADDQPTGLDGVDAADLSRGSAGTNDPFVGVAELPEGTYYVAVANQTQIPEQLNQFRVANPLNPLLRLEPIDSVLRIVEDRIGDPGFSGAAPPMMSQLFDPAMAAVPFTLNDVVLHTMSSGGVLRMVNPFTGENFGRLGDPVRGYQDLLMRSSGEMFAFSDPGSIDAGDFDASYAYYRFNQEDGANIQVGTSGLETYHLVENPDFDPEQEGSLPFLVARSNDGFQVLATTAQSNTLGFAVGNRPFQRPQLTTANNLYFQNILYGFDPRTGEFNGMGSPDRGIEGPFDSRAQGAGTQVRERGYIETGVDNQPIQVGSQLAVPAATGFDAAGNPSLEIPDGTFFHLQAGTQQFRMEFDSGPMLRLTTDPSAGRFVRESIGGEPVRFSLTSGGVTRVYELDTGPVIVLDASQIVDGAAVTITDATGAARQFEFDSSGTLFNPSAVRVEFTPGQSSAALAAALAAAINQTDFAASGHAVAGQGRVDLSGDATATPPQVAGAGLSVQGAFGSDDPNVIPIRVREDFSGAELAEAIAEATGGAFSGNLLNWQNVSSINLGLLDASGIAVATQIGSPGVSGGTRIPYLVSDTAEAIAQRVLQTVNRDGTLQSLGVSASRVASPPLGDGGAPAPRDAPVRLAFENAVLRQNDPNTNQRLISAELTLATPPGGLVTGVTMVGSTLFAVSDNGGLYRVNNVASRSAFNGAIGQYVPQSFELIGLNFTGLTTGPSNIPELTDAAGNPLLFGTTAQGRLYAFDTFGRLRPVFAGGASSIDVGAGVSGVEFSTLDFNLWNVTQRRAGDAGHGTTARFNDLTEVPVQIPGGSSFYFGADPNDPRFTTNLERSPFVENAARLDGQPVLGTYNFPGGAKGALQSDPFSLVGYSAADLPTLYFNYFLETDGLDSLIGEDEDGRLIGLNQDAFRVYVISEDGVQHLLATNNEAAPAPDDPDNPVFPIDPGFVDEFADPRDSTDPLIASTFAGDVDVDVQRLFDNSGSWRQARVSLSDFAGQENLRIRLEFSTSGSFSDGTLGVRALSGLELSDGDRFTIGGETFEIDLGPTIAAPAGSTLARFFAEAPDDPNHRVTVEVGGVTYVLNDGARDVGPDEVNVPLLQPGDSLLSMVTAATIAERLAEAIRDQGLPVEEVDFDFDRSGNNTLHRAVRLPAFDADVTFSGSGQLENSLDVDMFRLTLPAGATLSTTMQSTGTPFTSNIRVFDLQGRTLAGGTAAVQYTAPHQQTVVIGLSSGPNNDYNPHVEDSGSAGVVGSYNVALQVTRDLRVIRSGVRLQVTGGAQVSGGDDGVVTISGRPGARGIPIDIDIDMSATEVASVIRRALADRFSSGVQSVFPVHGDQIDLPGLDVQDRGPFALTGISPADRSGSNIGPQRTRSNAHEGVYVDDFIIGFAERGEIAFNATGVTDFIADLFPKVGSESRPVSGAYQMEIRDASEYINSLTGEPFRAFDTNDRLAPGVTITALPAADIVDGATFQLTDGVHTVTFEMDLLDADGIGTGVAAGRVRVPLVNPLSLPANRDGSMEVAAAIAAAINRPEVRGLLDVAAVPIDGIDSHGNRRLNLFGDVIVLDYTDVLGDPDDPTNDGVVRSERRGDSNRDRSSQGVIIIENSKFTFNSEAGIHITRDATSSGRSTQATDVMTPTVLSYPRNLVELNSQNLIPGVVAQSNVVAYNELDGISITGLADGGSISNPVGFDRIVNNTVVGGFVRAASQPEPAVFEDIFFSGGLTSFADAVASFNPGTGLTAPFDNPDRALGPPDGPGRSGVPLDGSTTVSLGRGGSMTLQFVDNFLTGSGDARPDLVIFEAGEIESVRVEISRDGETFFDVGVVGGIDNTVDIDAFGFGPQDRFSFVRLTDLRQGSQVTGPAGADIDAVGAISSVPRDEFVAGGRGLSVSQNAAPTLLNNVVSNSEVGLSIDPTSTLTVVGGTSLHRNETNAENPQSVPLGQFSQVIPDPMDLFTDPRRLSFAPRAGVPIIDSSIDSLEDRSSLATVRGAVGLSPSPIIAPRLDVNGQLRVDDPDVASPGGIGENVFKDRGAEERADLIGPRAVLISPRADDIGLDAGQAETVRGTPFDAFDIQLIDGIRPVDPGPGSGIDDATVNSAGVLVTKDGQPLVEGRDYRFGYDPSNNVIRITPIAGIWQEDSVYVVRLVDATDSLLRMAPGATFSDGGQTSLLTTAGERVNFEIEGGITVDVNLQPAFGQFDGQGLVIFDGAQQLTFELDTNDMVPGGRIAVPVPQAATSAQVAEALAAAINGAALNVTARVAGTRLQLLGPNPLTTVTPLVDEPPLFIIGGQIGTSVGFGIGVPSELGQLAPSVSGGQRFTIQRGASLLRTFQLDFGFGTTDPDAIRVDVGPNPTVDAVAEALVRAIGGAGLGLDPFHAGHGRVVLGGDANYALNLTETGLFQLGAAGQRATIPVVVPVDATIDQVADAFTEAIQGADLVGLSVAQVGDRLVLDGVAAASGTAAIEAPIIRDRVGNPLQSNRDTGATEMTIFVGGGFNFGNAPPELGYRTLLADDGPRHRVDRSFSLGPDVGPDADAVIPGGSSNDGVLQLGNAIPGTSVPMSLQVRNDDARPFYVDVWVDWNRSGSFSDAPTARFQGLQGETGQTPLPGRVPLGIGINSISLSVPSGTAAGPVWARVRLSEDPNVGPTGEASSGEVEDITILVQASPFQNADEPADVNINGIVTPLDALIVLNLLRDWGSGSIDVSPGALDPDNIPPNDPRRERKLQVIERLQSSQLRPDVNGDLRIDAADALRVLNVIAQQRRAAGEGEGGDGGEAVQAGADPMAFVPVADGVLASPLTVATELTPEQDRPDGPLAVDAAGPQLATAATKGSPSIFDSPSAMALDELLDDLAGDRHGGEETNLVDDVFANLGRGLA